MITFIDLQQDIAKSGREMNALEQEHARLIGALMCSAKLLQAAKRNYMARKPQETSCELADLLTSLLGLYGGDGESMEVETLALAGHLGFRIEQHYIPAASGVTH